jgi:DNA-damage-inducible protein J
MKKPQTAYCVDTMGFDPIVDSVLHLSYILGMNKTAVIQARIEPVTKRKAEAILKHLGVSPTDAIRMFYRQIMLRQGMPFAVQVPNRLTKETLRKSRAGKDVTSFDSLDEMFASWEK